MSSHLHLLVTFLVVFDTSYTLFLQTPFLLESSSADIVEQTRTQADTLKTSLKSLSSKPEAAPILERIFKAKKSDCIKNMDQAIEAIETSTRLFEKAGTEMKLLVQYVQEFQTINGTSKAVRQSAKIIRLLDVLIPKLTPSSFGCQKTSEDVLKSMRSLGAIVLDFSSENELYTSTHGRQNLKTSAKILSKVSDFLTKESHFEFDHFCTKDKEHNKGFITAVGKMMIDLADLYADLGGVAASFEFRNQENFTKKVVARINKLGDFDIVSLGCNTPGSSQAVANTLEDLAGIIDDVGMPELCKQLGLSSADCRF